MNDRHTAFRATAATLCSLLFMYAGTSAALAQSGRGVVSDRPEVPRGPGAQSGGTSGGGGESRDGDNGGGDDSTDLLGRGGGGSGDGGGDSDGRAYPLDKFRYYCSITTDPYERRQGRYWSQDLEFDPEVMSPDFMILYQHLLGNYPKGGPHLAQEPGYMDDHLAAIEADLDWLIPDKDFDGVAVIDYEIWRAVWERTPSVPSDLPPDAEDRDLQQDWRDYMRSVTPGFDSMSESEQEDLLRESYQNAVRDFFLATLERCRQLRPNAKWGFYGYPMRFFRWAPREAPRNVISYGDGTHAGSAFNDRLQWMWDAVDVITPSIYTPNVIVEPGEEVCRSQSTAEESWEFIGNMIAEARRVANGKPVLPFISKMYQMRGCRQWQDVDDEELFHQVFGPARLGADGAILWGGINNYQEFVGWQNTLDNRILPLMAAALDERAGREGDDGAGDGQAGEQSGKGGLAQGSDAVNKVGAQSVTASGPRVRAARSGGSAPVSAISPEEAAEALQRARKHLRPAKTEGGSE